MNHRRLYFFSVISWIWPLLLAGCSDLQTGLRWEVTLDGAPVQIAEKEKMIVSIFTKGDDTQPMHVARSIENGVFHSPPLPDGEYRIVINLFEKYPFGDRAANFFRENPSAVLVSLNGKASQKIDLQSKWFKRTKGKK